MNRRPSLPFSRRSDFGAPDSVYQSVRKTFDSHQYPLDLTITNATRAGLDLPPLNFRPSVTRNYQPEARGFDSARVALALSYQDRIHADSADFVLTASTSEAYSYVLHALCDPGDAIAVPSPSYPLFDQLAQLAGVKLHKYPIVYDGAFHIDLGRLPSREECEAKKIKALFCVSPNNPTGNSLRPEELFRLRDIDLPLVIDEVFRPYRDSSTSPADPLSGADKTPLTIVLDGLSKRAAAPGLKLAWMLVRGTRSEEFLGRAEWMGDAFLSPHAAVQTALSQLLKHESAAQDVILERIEACRNILNNSALREHGVSLLGGAGGWTSLMLLPSLHQEDEWWKKLSAAGLWLIPGALYGMEQTPVFAVSLLSNERKLKEGVARLIQVLQNENAPD